MVNHIQKKLCHEEDDEGSWDWIRVGFGRVWIRIGFGLDLDLDSDGIRIGLGEFCLASLWQTGHGNGKTSSRPAAIIISNPKWIHLDKFCVFSVIMFPGQCSAKSLTVCARCSSSLGLVCSSSIVW